MANIIIYSCLILTAVLGTFANLFLKRASMESANRKKLFYILTSILVFFVNYLLYIWILKWVSLPAAIPFTSLIFIFVPIGARIAFHEELRPSFWGGSVLIILGIIITI